MRRSLYSHSHSRMFSRSLSSVVFYSACLKRIYHIDPSGLDQSTWHCPSCESRCTCAGCTRGRRNLMQTAAAAGISRINSVNTMAGWSESTTPQTRSPSSAKYQPYGGVVSSPAMARKQRRSASITSSGNDTSNSSSPSPSSGHLPVNFAAMQMHLPAEIAHLPQSALAVLQQQSGSLHSSTGNSPIVGHTSLYNLPHESSALRGHGPSRRNQSMRVPSQNSNSAPRTPTTPAPAPLGIYPSALIQAMKQEQAQVLERLEAEHLSLQQLLDQQDRMNHLLFHNRAHSESTPASSPSYTSGGGAGDDEYLRSERAQVLALQRHLDRVLAERAALDQASREQDVLLARQAEYQRQLQHQPTRESQEKEQKRLEQSLEILLRCQRELQEQSRLEAQLAAAAGIPPFQQPSTGDVPAASSSVAMDTSSHAMDTSSHAIPFMPQPPPYKQPSPMQSPPALPTAESVSATPSGQEANAMQSDSIPSSNLPEVPSGQVASSAELKNSYSFVPGGFGDSVQLSARDGTASPIFTSNLFASSMHDVPPITAEGHKEESLDQILRKEKEWSSSFLNS